MTTRELVERRGVAVQIPPEERAIIIHGPLSSNGTPPEGAYCPLPADHSPFGALAGYSMDLMPTRTVKSPVLTDLIGNTPLIRLEHAHFRHVEIWAKLEYLNPGGSVKDRAAKAIIEDGERTGRLTKDKIIVDATSGNTGIAYAMIGAARGYRVELVIPKNVSEERKRIVLAYGATIRYSSEFEGSDGAIRVVRQMVAEHPDRYFYGDQYNNAANWKAHHATTGPEIWKQTGGRVTHFVACVGTSGTLMGTGRRLKAYNRKIRVVEIQPEEALHGIEGIKHMPTSIQPQIWDEGFADSRILVKTEDAYE